MHDVVVESDEPSARPQRVAADPQEAEELFPGAGVVQQIHGHDEVRGPGLGLEIGGVLTEIRAAQRVPLFLAPGQADHLGGDVDPGDPDGAGPLEQAGVEALPAGEVQHRHIPDVPQRLEQRVALDGLPERELFGVLVRPGDRVVLGHVPPRQEPAPQERSRRLTGLVGAAAPQDGGGAAGDDFRGQGLRRRTVQTPGRVGWCGGAARRRRSRRRRFPGYGTSARPMLLVSVPNQIARVGAWKYMWRTVPPPLAISVSVKNSSVAGSKPTNRFGRTPDSTK